MFPFKDNIPGDRFPFVTVGLILVNVVGYVLLCVHGGSLWSGPGAHQMSRWAATPATVTVRTALTGMFVNGSLVQLLGDMLFLWWFGANVEDSMKPLRFLALYAVLGLLTFGLFVALAPGATHPTPLAGGAVAGILGAYLVLYRRARLLTLSILPVLGGVFEIPVLAMLVLWLAMQAAFGNGSAADLAQLVALLAGAAAVRRLATRVKPTPPTAAALR